MNIKYEIEPVFKIEFFKIKCVDFKNKKKKLDLHNCGVGETEKAKKWDDLGQMLVPGILNNTKKIRKAGVDIFTNVGLEN